MYLPKHFEQQDPAELAALMQAHPLATLVSWQDGAPTADHVPLEYDATTQTLRGHVARTNPLWRLAGQRVLAVFNGPQAYVSPSWYPSKAEAHKVVPTWNYTVVHAHGELQVVDQAPWLHELVTRLTQRHEMPQRQPWSVSDAPQDFVQAMLRAIVGIEIPVTRLIGKWKMSQNRSETDRSGVAVGLSEDPQRATVAQMVLQGTAPRKELP